MLYFVHKCCWVNLLGTSLTYQMILKMFKTIFIFVHSNLHSTVVLQTFFKSSIWLYLVMVVWLFCLCSSDLPKQPRTEYPFYRFFYSIVSASVSGELTDAACEKWNQSAFNLPFKIWVLNFCLLHKIFFRVKKFYFCRLLIIF